MTSYAKFKIGMKVLLDPNKCTEEDLRSNRSSGTIGSVYTIDDIDYDSAYFGTANWHMLEWLTIVVFKNKIGGKLNGKK